MAGSSSRGDGGGEGGGGFGRDRPLPGSRWSGEGAGRSDPKNYPPQRAPSGLRAPYGHGQDGRSYGPGPGRNASSGSAEWGHGHASGGGGRQGHQLRESDFPLEMGGAARTEKQPQLRPRGDPNYYVAPNPENIELPKNYPALS